MRFTLLSCALLLMVINGTAQISTAENGLNTPNSTTVRLGGTLLQTTSVDLGSSYDFHFLKGSTPYFSILNNGNVGIGNSSPGARLSLPNVDVSTDPVGLTWYSGDPLNYGIHRTAGSWLAPNYQQLRLSWLTGIVLNPGTSFAKSYVDITGNGLRVTSGNVGIGTTSPGVMLSLGGSVLNSKLAIWEGDYNGQIVRSGFGIAPGQFRFHVAGPNNRFSFLSDEAGTSEVMTISGTGKVGIGNTNPTGRLHIIASTADASATDFQLSDNANGNILSIRNDQKLTLGSGTQNSQLSIAGTGPLSGIYSPAYASGAGNIIGFKDYAGNTRMTLDMSSGTDGKLGIGTTNIGTVALAIEKSNNDGGTTNAPIISVKNTSTTQPAGSGYNVAGANFLAGNGAVWGQCVANYGVGASAPWNSGTGFYVTTRTDHPIIFATGASTAERMRIGANGNVGIGTTNINDAGYKLFVEGNIRTRKVRVDHDNWPDYVFDTNYQLTPLHEVEQYIQQQKHLLEVPSAAEVKKEGVDLGDNQAVLLKKIEELTLYVIQQQKQLETQQKKIEALEKKVADKN